MVLWFKHDSYDQLIMAQCLATLAQTPPRQFEMVALDRYPGSTRFIGLGQLPPEAIYLLWSERRPVSVQQFSSGRLVWDALRAPGPMALSRVATAGIAELPFMAAAIRRHCQELPSARGGLSLTERMVLKLLARRPSTVGEVYRDIRVELEPLPWLTDLMFRFIVDSMKRVREPVFTGMYDEGEQHWPREHLAITELGRAVLAGEVDWLSLNPPVRWLGGVHIPSSSPCWRWDDWTSTVSSK